MIINLCQTEKYQSFLSKWTTRRWKILELNKLHLTQIVQNITIVLFTAILSIDNEYWYIDFHTCSYIIIIFIFLYKDSQVSQIFRLCVIRIIRVIYRWWESIIVIITSFISDLIAQNASSWIYINSFWHIRYRYNSQF